MRAHIFLQTLESEHTKRETNVARCANSKALNAQRDFVHVSRAVALKRVQVKKILDATPFVVVFVVVVVVVVFVVPL